MFKYTVFNKFSSNGGIAVYTKKNENGHDEHHVLSIARLEDIGLHNMATYRAWHDLVVPGNSTEREKVSYMKRSKLKGNFNDLDWKKQVEVFLESEDFNVRYLDGNNFRELLEEMQELVLEDFKCNGNQSRAYKMEKLTTPNTSHSFSFKTKNMTEAEVKELTGHLKQLLSREGVKSRLQVKSI